MRVLVRHFGISLFVTIATVIAVLLGLGIGPALVTLLLILIEITFSFENAVINAKVLQTLSKKWQTLFLTVGIIIAIFGMRLVFPVLIVALTSGLSWHDVVTLALKHPHEYAEKLEAAHPAISAFGGAFLLMLTFQFFFDERRQVRWFEPLERVLQRVERKWVPGVLTISLLALLAALPFNQHPGETLRAGILGVVVYVAMQFISDLFESMQAKRLAGTSTKGSVNAPRVGWAAFSSFLYLEVLDASFSFDGVIGAFAVTSSVVLIAAGLGIGAVWVRSLTVMMVRRHTLKAYRYLEHGAHYTVAVLAATLLLSVLVEVPELIAGLAGIAFIGGSFYASRQAAQREAAR